MATDVTRRNFLRSAGIGAAATAVVGAEMAHGNTRATKL